ncbi:protein translocase subunit SecF [Candidatus Woesearchaeota archaeon]|nr:protein translocase subunit SecF [Candidatus Woesearchaeota archaeon]MBL7051346.1 protein translocase subunit SecF [Candidatus Woesearchaeota archaeon]
MSRRDRRLRRFHEKRKKIIETVEEAPKKFTPTEKQRETKNPFLHFYNTQYKKLLIIPILMLLIAIIVIASQAITTGEFIHKAVSLKGGTTITIPTDKIININMLEDLLSQEFNELDIAVRSLTKAGTSTGIIIDTDIQEQKDLQTFLIFLESKIGNLGEYSTEHMGSALGASFFKETIIALLLAFTFMGIIVFLYFKTFVPSIAVILAAVSDIIVTLAIVNLMGIKLSTAGIAAFLMIIGYSVDTDILLTTRLIKRKEGTLFQRLINAMKTGLTMTITTMAVVILALIFTQSETIRQIMTILLIGLIVDIINTWIQNVGILRLYIDKKQNGKD